MFFHNFCCRVFVVLLFSAAVLLGMFSRSDSQDEVVCPQRKDDTTVPVSRSQKNEECTAEETNRPEEDEIFFLTLPFVEPDGSPVAAMLDDTNQVESNIDINFLDDPMPYMQWSRLKFALWANGKIIWKSDNGQYYQSHIATDAVKELLSSIRIEDYNTTDSMRYSCSGGRLGDESFTILYVSKGTGNNVILYSPFHFWKKQGIYKYWDESSPFADSYYAEKFSWPQFCEKVPRKFLSYLTTWESLQSKLLSLRPDPNHFDKIDLMKDIKQITYLYECKKRTPVFVRVPKERWKKWLSPLEMHLLKQRTEGEDKGVGSL